MVCDYAGNAIAFQMGGALIMTGVKFRCPDDQEKNET